jgi:hypothetical protein
MSIASQCPSCCDCPVPVVQWDSVSASLAKFGFSEYGTPSSPPKRYLTTEYTGSWTRAGDTITFNGFENRDEFTGANTASGTITTAAGDCAFVQGLDFNPDGAGTDTCNGVSVSIFEEGISINCDRDRNVNAVFSSEILSSTQINWPGCSEYSTSGTGVWTLTNENTTANLRSNAQTLFPAFDDDWNDTVGSFANTGTDELDYVARKSRYRIRLPVPKVRTGKCYRIDWVERFVPEAGAGLTSAAVFERGVYRPIVTVTGDGTGCEMVAVMSSGGGVASLRVLNPGSGYTTATITVQTAVNGGTTSTGWTATVANGQVAAATGGSTGNYLPTATVFGGGGTGATATFTMDETGGIASVSTSPGSGYNTSLGIIISRKITGFVDADILPVYGTETAKCAEWDGTTLAGEWVVREVADGGHALTSIEVVHGGSGFVATPTVTITGGGGSGATATATVSGGAITAIALTNPGSGYTSNPLIRLSYYGSETVLFAAHFGTETEYADGTEPPGAIPKGYVDGETRTYPVIGDTGTAPWKYFELPVPTTDGTTTVQNVRAVCDCSSC